MEGRGLTGPDLLLVGANDTGTAVAPAAMAKIASVASSKACDSSGLSVNTPIRAPLSLSGSSAAKFGSKSAGLSALAASAGSWPAMADNRIAASTAWRAIGPAESSPTPEVRGVCRLFLNRLSSR